MSFEERRTRRWYVAQTHSAKEASAACHLERQGFATFVPQVIRSIRRAGGVRRVPRPLFPRYLFVALDLEADRWRAVRSTFGVRCLIMDGDRPRPVPAGLVEGLATACGDRAGATLGCQLAVGDRVRFLCGPFEDQLGRLVAMKDAERVGVLLEILGAEREITVDAGLLLRAGR